VAPDRRDGWRAARFLLTRPHRLDRKSTVDNMRSRSLTPWDIRETRMALPRPPASSRSSRPLGAIAPVAFRTIAEQVADAIRAAIAEGRIRPGTRLLEVSLAREMETSRAPIREALGELAREGLVVKEPNRGALVVELTEEIVREVGSLRGLLEGFAASLAAQRLDGAQFAALDTMVREMERAAQQGEYARLVDADYRFHDFICRCAGHGTLYETWQAISGKVRLYLSTTNLMYRNLKAVVRGHGEIVAALRSRDAARANRVMQDHLGETLDDFIARLRGTGRGRRPTSPSAIFRESRRARRLAVARLGHTRDTRARGKGST
jgi:DNA-binding GntR family transcriptional regulator